MATASSVDKTRKEHLSSDSGRLPLSPLGATPRPALRQKYSVLQSSVRSFISEYEINDKCSTTYNQIKPVERSSTRSFVILIVIFLTSVIALAIVAINFPKLEEDEKQHIKLPRNIDDAKNLGKVLSRYKDTYYYQVLGAYFITYIFLQSFAIPGSIFLSILSGFLFKFHIALFLVCLEAGTQGSPPNWPLSFFCKSDGKWNPLGPLVFFTCLFFVCSGIGASFCYLLSYLVGRRLVQKYIPERVEEWRSHVERHREHLLNYIVFLRITPFLPNWFINITSPVINVPMGPFFLGTFLGVAPPSFVAIQAGTTLHQLTSSGDAVSWTSMFVLGLFAILSLLPVILKKQLKEKFD